MDLDVVASGIVMEFQFGTVGDTAASEPHVT
jgi:hypothetical protein